MARKKKKITIIEEEEDVKVLEVSFTDKPWDGDKSRFSIDQLLKSVPKAIAKWAKQKAKDEGREVIKDDLKLPIREPDGTVNVNALRNALARISQVKGVPQDVLDDAEKEIRDLLDQYKKKTGQERLQPAEIIESMASDVADGFEPQDKEGRKIRVVVIRAGKSKNNNVWTEDLLRESAPMFEGAKVFYDHRDWFERSAKDIVGYLEDVKYVDGRIEATLVTHSEAKVIRAVAKEMPHVLGMSVFVNATASYNENDNTWLINRINEVVSVDVVDNPSAGGAILEVLESVRKGDEMKEKLAKLEAELKEAKERIEALAKEKAEAEKKLVEAEAKLRGYELKSKLGELIEAARKEGAELKEPMLKLLELKFNALLPELGEDADAKLEAAVKEVVDFEKSVKEAYKAEEVKVPAFEQEKEVEEKEKAKADEVIREITSEIFKVVGV